MSAASPVPSSTALEDAPVRSEAVPYTNKIPVTGVRFGFMVPFNVPVVVPMEVAAVVVAVGLARTDCVVNDIMEP